MDIDLLKSFGQVAGIGGLALGIVLLVFREIVRKGAGGRDQAKVTRLLTTVAALTALVGLAGIGAWVWAGSPPGQGRASVSADHGSVSAGGNITGTVTVGAPPAKGP